MIDERMVKLLIRSREDWDKDYDKQIQDSLCGYLAKRLEGAGYRLDPYPNGKSKPELIARIKAVEAERDKTRNLLRNEHGKVVAGQGQSWAIHLLSDPDCPVCTFLAETSSVKP